MNMTKKETSFSAQMHTEANTAVIDLQGEINGLADAALEAAYAQAAQGAPHKILLDFTAVDYINSTGIALIVGLLAKARSARIPLAAAGLSDHYREIFTITRLSDFMEIEP
jgi:anti-anti-sigma factor